MGKWPQQATFIERAVRHQRDICASQQWKHFMLQPAIEDIVMILNSGDAGAATACAEFKEFRHLIWLVVRNTPIADLAGTNKRVHDSGHFIRRRNAIWV